MLVCGQDRREQTNEDVRTHALGDKTMSRLVNRAAFGAGAPRHFTSLDLLVPWARSRARQFLYDGIADEYGTAVTRACASFLDDDPERTVLCIFTRDTGHHGSGWWKNPDFERCWHLSLSHRWVPSDTVAVMDLKKNEEIARAVFGEDARWAWLEGAFTVDGKERDVMHYRLFADEGWYPIKPHGEVYDRRNTPPDWRSFSEIHGYRPGEEDAPFLTQTSESGT